MSMQSILLVPSAAGVGLSSAALGLMHALDCKGIHSEFYKPFAQYSRHSDTENRADLSLNIYQQLFQSQAQQPIALAQLHRALATGRLDELLEQVVQQHHLLGQNRQVVIIEGIVPDEHHPFAYEVNAALAKSLNANVLLVSSAQREQPEQTARPIEAMLRYFNNSHSVRTIGVMMMRCQGWQDDSEQLSVTANPNPEQQKAQISDFEKQLQPYLASVGSTDLPIIALVPFSQQLSVPRTWDIAQYLDCSWLNQGEAKQRRVLHYSLIADSVASHLAQFIAGELLICPSAREDVILAAALACAKGIPLAGLLLTENQTPNAALMQYCQLAAQQGLPVLHAESSTLDCIQRLQNFHYELAADDVAQAQRVVNFVSNHIDPTWLAQLIERPTIPRLSPAAFRHALVQKAMLVHKRIVLPEGEEPRTIQAAAQCQARGIAQCMLLGNPDKIRQIAQARGINLPDQLEIIDPETIREHYVSAMVERRKGKLDANQARAQLQDHVVLGTMMLALDEVDGLVSGAIHTTANTVRPAFQLIKTATNYSLVSSLFFMLLPDEVMVYADCAINPDPDAEQLAEIAIQSAESARAFGIEPRIAMISYSTGESGTGADVDKVRLATERVRQRRPDLVIDGPLQYDAASVLSVGQQKAPQSKVAGHANVFIFPDLNTGNTTYKAVQRSANVLSVGPMLQGLNKPVNDLSRGALVEDIIYTIALTAIQAQGG